MKKLGLLVLTILVVLTASFVPGCSSKSPAKNTSSTSGSKVSGAWVGKKIGIADISLYDEWCQAVAGQFTSQGKAAGFAELNNQNGNLDAETQQKQVENFIAKKYDMILIDPVSPDGIKPTLDKAKAAGIPVICFDSSTTWSDIITHVAWDDPQTGVLSADYIAKYAQANLGGKVKIGMLEMLAAPHTAIRGTAFKQELEKDLGKSNITYVFEQDFGNTVEKAQTIVTNNIAKPMDFIWGAVDNAAQGARLALQTNGITKTQVVSDGAWGDQPFNEINDGDANYTMCIGVSPISMVQLVLTSAEDYFAGKTSSIPKEQNCELDVIDKTNISQFVQFITKKS